MLQQRSYKKELLDHDDIPFADIRQNMQELDFINKWLGGHAITTNAFSKFAALKKTLTVCEIGCGGGDNLAAIYNWCKQHNITVSLIGIDLKAECIEYAKSRKSLPASVQWLVSDYTFVQFQQKPDIIFSSLFCHHFTNEQLVFQLQWMQQNCTLGFFINDLQRHVLAYYSIRLLTRLFSRSYLVKNDAPLSVARGFKKNELEAINIKAGIKNATINWKWAFRYQLIYFKT